RPNPARPPPRSARRPRRLARHALEQNPDRREGMGPVHRRDGEAGNRQRDPQRPGAGDESADGDDSRRPPKADPRRDKRPPLPAVGGTGTVERPSGLSRVTSILLSRT